MESNNTTQEQKDLALKEAILNDNSCYKKLLEQGANPNQSLTYKNKNHSLLEYVIHKEHYKDAVELIKHNADVDVLTYNNDSMLHLACEASNLSLVEAILSKSKTNINHLDNQGNNCLHRLFNHLTYENNYQNKLSIFKLLLKNGINVNNQGHDKEIILNVYFENLGDDFSFYNKKYTTQILKLFVKHKIDLTLQNNEVLFYIICQACGKRI